ncbi:MAG: hypothetical protein PHC70_03020 [Patescibacteria group bacterium]|nr:hypothetical protein [Patescibacteria group bacterium]
MNGSTANIIVVPDLSPVKLVAQAKKKARLTYLNPNLKTRNFCAYRVEKDEPARVLEVRGKKYEVLTWKPGEYVTTEQVRNHFKVLEADGNTAAFITWISKVRPVGFHTSVPSDDALLFCDPDGSFYAPIFSCVETCRHLDLRDVDNGWDDYWVFVAFREITS